jgi:hypothetical protein
MRKKIREGCIARQLMEEIVIIARDKFMEVIAP